MSHRRARASVAFFEEAVDAIVGRRKALIARGEAAPRDLLTLLLEASDPLTGTGLTDEEVRANVVTFIGAGHETTANALTWSLFLLSLSPEWRERLASEADRVLDGPIEGALDRLVETRAVIEEAMRLYPPVASLSREAIGPDDLCGRTHPQGCARHRLALGAASPQAAVARPPIASIPAASCLGRARRSTASPTSHSAPARGFASARRSRCRRR